MYWLLQAAHFSQHHLGDCVVYYYYSGCWLVPACWWFWLLVWLAGPVLTSMASDLLLFSLPFSNTSFKEENFNTIFALAFAFGAYSAALNILQGNLLLTKPLVKQNSKLLRCIQTFDSPQETMRNSEIHSEPLTIKHIDPAQTGFNPTADGCRSSIPRGFCDRERAHMTRTTPYMV